MNSLLAAMAGFGRFGLGVPGRRSFLYQPDGAAGFTRGHEIVPE